jgi:hypothetical protein
MGQPSLILNRGAGGLGRPLAGEDHISGFAYYADTADLPTGFGTDRIKQIFSIGEAEDLGIVEGDADFGLLWYHLNEYFRLQPKGNLYVQIINATGLTPATHNFVELDDLRRFAEGKIRQIAVYAPTFTFAAAQVTALQAKVNFSRTEDQPISSVLYGADISGVADLSTLPDMRALNAESVSVCIGQDGGAAGFDLFDDAGVSITTVGALLGAVSFASVNESIAWVEKFNLVSGAELEVAAFANGDTLKSKSKAFVDALNDKGYIFLRKFTNIGLAGTYFNDSHTSVPVTSDYAYIENNRTIDKAIRNITKRVTPKLSSPLVVNPDGTLFEDTIDVFRSLTDQALTELEVDAEISAKSITINPKQNVLATSKIFISVKIVPTGTARTIEYLVGYATNV